MGRSNSSCRPGVIETRSHAQHKQRLEPLIRKVSAHVDSVSSKVILLSFSVIVIRHKPLAALLLQVHSSRTGKHSDCAEIALERLHYGARHMFTLAFSFICGPKIAFGGSSGAHQALLMSWSMHMHSSRSPDSRVVVLARDSPTTPPASRPCHPFEKRKSLG